MFWNPLSITADNPLHSENEDPIVTMRVSERGRILAVVHAERNGTGSNNQPKIGRATREKNL